MEYFTTLLINEGYETFGKSCFFPNQNANAKTQNDFMFSTKKDLIFVEGNYKSKEGVFYFRKHPNDFSSMKVGGIDVFYIKAKNFKEPFIWGLNEIGKPPILKYPRPKIVLKRMGEKGIEFLSEIHDDAMSLCLSKEKHIDILNAIRNDGGFSYDLT